MEVQANSLGSYYSEYKNNTVKTNNIAFKPDKSTGYFSAYSIPSTNPSKLSDFSNSTVSLIQDESDSESESGSESSENNKKEKPIYSIGKNPINNIFIGSVTVLGLFLLYRLLQKGK